jgi:transposase
MNKPRKRSKETDEAYKLRAIKLYYTNGYHIDEISERLNIPMVDVYNVVSSGHKITTEEERQEMIHLRNLGYTHSYIANIFGRSRSCIQERINSSAKCTCATATKLTDKQLEQIKSMIKEGMYISDIARELGVSRRTVNDRVKRCGLSSPKKPVTEKEVKRFIRLRKNGHTYKEIAKRCNRCEDTVFRHIKKYKENN